jgi:rhodanese-related sulfurtransferase
VSIQQISAEQAHTLMTQDPSIIYLDVRTVTEFEAGHPPAALNIPVVVPNPAIRKMTPNPGFLPTVEASLAKDAKIIVGCMSGGRSQYAAEVLEDAGYQNVANMQGGFGGARDQMGRVSHSKGRVVSYLNARICDELLQKSGLEVNVGTD